MSNLLREGNWNKELEGGLPDCRLRDPSKKTVYRGRIAYEWVYCANCGEPDGLITAEWSPHVFCLCKKCSAIFGKLNVPEVDEELVRGRKPLLP